MSGIFKAYDVRGLYPSEINEEMALRIGQVFHHVLQPEDLEKSRTVVVSHDMRSHSGPLYEALISGLLDSGLDVCRIGLATTPMNYFAVGHLEVAGGVQVTASHNPAAYNGLKFSRSEAKPVSGDEGIPRLEQEAAKESIRSAEKPGETSDAAILEVFQQHLLGFLQPAARQRKLRTVVDAANGMGCIYADILAAAGLDLDLLYFELDGTFPNHEANPLRPVNLRDLQRRVVEVGADWGIAFDGDADRAAFVDEQGRIIGNDLTTALIAGEILQRDPGTTIVYDLRSSRAVAEYIRERGGKPIRERVGHSFIKATLRQHHGAFGGELAGHYYFRDNYYADSSMLAVIEMMNLIASRDEPLSEIVAPLRRYAKSDEINFEVDDKAAMIEELGRRYSNGRADDLDGITVQFDDWWFNVRPSNTEPLLRLVLEAADDESLAARQDELVGLLGEPV